MRPRTHCNDGEEIGVYALISPSGRVYVGMTCDSFERRWSAHEKHLRGNRHSSPGLQRAYNRYGWENLGKIVLQIWEKPETLEELLELEREILVSERQWWERIKGEGSAMLHGCPSGTGGVIHSEETKAKISAASSGKIRLSTEEKELFLQGVRHCNGWNEVKALTGMTRRKLLSRGFTKEELSTLPFLQRFQRSRATRPLSRDELYDLYIHRSMGVMEIAREKGLFHAVVSNLLDEYDIPKRSRQEAGALRGEKTLRAKASETRICAVCAEVYLVAERPRSSTCSNPCAGRYRRAPHVAP